MGAHHAQRDASTWFADASNVLLPQHMMLAMEGEPCSAHHDQSHIDSHPFLMPRAPDSLKLAC